MAKRFILNVDAKVVHDREHLTEACNSDQIKKRRYSDAPLMSYAPCQHCMVELYLAEEPQLGHLRQVPDDYTHAP